MDLDLPVDLWIYGSATFPALRTSRRVSNVPRAQPRAQPAHSPAPGPPPGHGAHQTALGRLYPYPVVPAPGGVRPEDPPHWPASSTPRYQAYMPFEHPCICVACSQHPSQEPVGITLHPSSVKAAIDNGVYACSTYDGFADHKLDRAVIHLAGGIAPPAWAPPPLNLYGGGPRDVFYPSATSCSPATQPPCRMARSTHAK